MQSELAVRQVESVPPKEKVFGFYCPLKASIILQHVVIRKEYNENVLGDDREWRSKNKRAASAAIVLGQNASFSEAVAVFQSMDMFSEKARVLRELLGSIALRYELDRNHELRNLYETLLDEYMDIYWYEFNSARGTAHAGEYAFSGFRKVLTSLS